MVLVAGTKAHAETLREEVAAVLAPMGLRLSEAKTTVCHIDEGFDFLGFRIQRRRKRGTTKRVVYTYPSKKALASIVGRVRTLTRRTSHPTLAALLRQLNPVLRGWCTYFRHGVSKATFAYLDQYTWHRVVRWIRKRHHQDEVGRPLPPLSTELASSRGRRGVVPTPDGDGQPLPLPGREHPIALADKIIRRRSHRPTDTGSWRAGCVETRTSGSEGGMRKRNACKGVNAPHPDPTRPRTARSRSPAGSDTARRRR